MKYRFIDRYKDAHPITSLCQTLGVSPQAYYGWRKRKPGPRHRSNGALLEQIRSVHQNSRRNYGSPRVHRELREQSVRCSRKRVARLMRTHGVHAKTVHRFRVATDSAHALPVAPNLLDRQFTVATPNRAWVTDITYVPTREGWLYLCVFLDLFSRRVVGWAMSERVTAELVTSALSMAVQQRHPGAGLLIHSDRGSQYASEFYQKRLTAGQFVCSMSRKGNCWDNNQILNSVAESFFHTLKGELIHHAEYQTRAQARTEIFEFIEVFYNRVRRHSTLDYQTPLLFERRHQQQQVQARLAALGQEVYPTVNHNG